MNYCEIMEFRNCPGGFSDCLGIKTTKIEKGYAEGELEIRAEHHNPQGILHGGLLFTMADTIGGSAAMSYGKEVVTVNGNIEYLNPGDNVKTLYAYAKEIKHGHKISRYKIDLYDHTKRLLATGNFTYYSSGREII